MNKFSILVLGILCIITAQENYSMNYEGLMVLGNQMLSCGELAKARSLFVTVSTTLQNETEYHTFVQALTTIHNEQLNLANQALAEGKFKKAEIAGVAALTSSLQGSVEANNANEFLKKISSLYIAQGEQELNTENYTGALTTFTSAKQFAQFLIQETTEKPENYYTIEVFLDRVYEGLSKSGIQPDFNQVAAETHYREAARHGNTEGKFRLGSSLVEFLKNKQLNPDSLFYSLRTFVMNEAEQNFKSVIATPNVSRQFKALSFYHLGILYLSKNDRENAKNCFIAAANMRHYVSMHNCAQIALQEEKTDKALEFFAAAAPHLKQSARALARLKHDLSQTSTSKEQKSVHEKRAYSFVDGVLEDNHDQDEQAIKKTREV